MTSLEHIANIAALIILVLTPIMFIALFWMVHILPEKIAHKKNHPQKEAIKILVYMSLLFGGMLWPIAWVWTYLKSPRLKISQNEIRLDAPEGHVTETMTELSETTVENKPQDEAVVKDEIPLAWRKEIEALNLRLESMRRVAEEYEEARSALASLQAKASGDTSSPNQPKKA
ncbi:MAG: DUF3302 domain-containing protein [Puniceicoccales bacterium]